MHLVASVCLSVLFMLLTLKDCDLETLFLRRVCIFRISKQSLYIKVIRSGAKRCTNITKYTHLWVVCFQLNDSLV